MPSRSACGFTKSTRSCRKVAQSYFTDFVEVFDELGAVVDDDLRAGVAALAEEDVEEVRERLLVVRQLTNLGVGIEPQELAFLVVILPATPVGPRLVASAKNACGNRGVVGGAPQSATFGVEVGGRGSEEIAVTGLRLEACACSEHVAEVLRHAFIDPEQLTLLGSREVRLVEVVWAAVLAVPRVRELVREQIGDAKLMHLVGEAVFANAVVGRLAVLETFAAGDVRKA